MVTRNRNKMMTLKRTKMMKMIMAKKKDEDGS